MATLEGLDKRSLTGQSSPAKFYPASIVLSTLVSLSILSFAGAEMQYIHAREYLEAGQSIRVDCDTQCNVRLTDDVNFSQFRRGGRHNYYGGFYRRFPCVITPPHAGYWNVTIDLAGGRANIRYSITVIGRSVIAG